MTPPRIEENLRATPLPQRSTNLFSVLWEITACLAVNKVSELTGTKDTGGERPCPKIRSVVSTSSQQDAELTFSFPLNSQGRAQAAGREGTVNSIRGHPGGQCMTARTQV